MDKSIPYRARCIVGWFRYRFIVYAHRHPVPPLVAIPSPSYRHPVLDTGSNWSRAVLIGAVHYHA